MHQVIKRFSVRKHVFQQYIIPHFYALTRKQKVLCDLIANFIFGQIWLKNLDLAKYRFRLAP
jgi:hypothetical protein